MAIIIIPDKNILLICFLIIMCTEFCSVFYSVFIACEPESALLGTVTQGFISSFSVMLSTSREHGLFICYNFTTHWKCYNALARVSSTYVWLLNCWCIDILYTLIASFSWYIVSRHSFTFYENYALNCRLRKYLSLIASMIYVRLIVLIDHIAPVCSREN